MSASVFTSLFKHSSATAPAPTTTPQPATIPSAPPPLPPNVRIAPITNQTHLHSFRRINSLLLPIRYPDAFYTSILTEPASASLTYVALRDDAPRRKRKRDDTKEADKEDTSRERGQREENADGRKDAAVEGTGEEAAEGKVIGGIRARLEPHLSPIPGLPLSINSTTEPLSSNGTSTTYPDSSSDGATNCPPPPPLQQQRLYIQTISLLSPYRSLGIGTALLQSIVQPAVRDHGISLVYAHVWEANVDAVEWYRKKGFQVGELVEGYYRKLRPGGARVVWKEVGVLEKLAAEGKGGVWEEREGNGEGRVEDERGG